LDEPTNGVDVIARGEVWEILRQLQEMAVVMSTGYLNEVERCDELIYLYAGRIRVRGTPAEVCASYPYHAYRLVGSGVETGIATEERGGGGGGTQTVGGGLVMETPLETAKVTAALQEMGVQEVWVEPLPPPLERVFPRLTHEAQPHA